MARGKNYDIESVLSAIDGSGGIMSAVARSLQCDWNTAHKYVHKWAATREAWADETEKILDMAESVLFRSIRDGDTGDAKWLLSKRGRGRGYRDALELTGDTTRPIGIAGVDYRDAVTSLAPRPVRNRDASGEDQGSGDG